MSLEDTILFRLLEGSKRAWHEAKKSLNKIPVYTGTALPKPGDIIYVRTSMYIDRGEDDVVGGKARVRSVEPLQGHNLGYVNVWEHPGHSYGWASLLSEQPKLAAEFGDTWAYPDPEH